MENSIKFFLNTHLEWSLSHQGFAITPVLAAPDLDKEFRVEADASNYATRVLSMNCSDEKWRPVAFIS